MLIHEIIEHNPKLTTQRNLGTRPAFMKGDFDFAFYQGKQTSHTQNSASND